jgi:hypothetical protein
MKTFMIAASAAAYAGAATIAIMVAAYGDWRAEAATVVACALAAVPALLAIERRCAERVHELAQGNRNASTEFFVGRIKQITYEHTQAVAGLSADYGATKQRLSDAEDLIRRMTDRPKVRGKFARAARIEQG